MASSKDKHHKTDPNAAPSDRTPPPAQHVWLAGMGAMAKAQQEGTKAMEALVNEGLAFQRKSQAEAQQRMQEATERLSHLANDFGQVPAVRVDKLEHLFEDRVAKALHRLGMPSLLDIQMLSDRVAQLEAQLSALGGPASSQRQAAAPRATGQATGKATGKVTGRATVKATGKVTSKAAPKGHQPLEARNKTT